MKFIRICRLVLQEYLNDLQIIPLDEPYAFNGHQGTTIGSHKADFSIVGKINWKEFGLPWNAALKAGRVVMANEVSINAEV
ncbi:hypothetical protein QRD02_06965 [Aequorivita sp. SDUM287046]|uniref:Uncharacterized protein n=1 Tax=Aequorivita aurantiaca TaxID=3053356 RepID=A0ABT8DM49_9FLAO|nr:hypothetical protein [Aequorivita aurantiaca]MDN3724117.1 hypothetical protein [Aequorivita aurantiaca]